MAQSTLRNEVLAIAMPDGKHGYELIEKNLKHILIDHPNVKGKKVAVLSIAGKYRMGKSFLLNFFIPYLGMTKKDAANWLKPERNDLQNKLDKLFHYRAGSKTDTKGILVWSEPILVTNSDGEELALILMDTQGSFDNESTREETATIFALSTMVSSILIYNVSKQLDFNELENLQYFAKYGELAMDRGNDADEKMPPFQSLLFLIRDWQHSEEYGFGGGQQSLDDHLTPKENDTPVMRKLRADIRDKLFQSVRCFSMPDPGKKVKATAYNGDLRVIDEDFLKQMRALLPGIFADLRAKCVNGQALTGQELYVYFTQYFNVFKSGKMPDVKNIFEATAEANQQIAKAAALKVYIDEMEKRMQGPVAFGDEQLEKLHKECEDTAIEHFDNKKKLGDSSKCLGGLFKEIHLLYNNQFIKSNAEKAAKNKLIAEADHQKAKAAALKLYTEKMEMEMQGEKSLGVKLLGLGIKYKHIAIELFNNAKKFGAGGELTDKYRKKLLEEIQQIYNGFVEKDEKKAKAEEKERQWKEKTAKMEKDNEANREKMAKMEKETSEKIAKMTEELKELIKDREAYRERIDEIKEQFEAMSRQNAMNAQMDALGRLLGVFQMGAHCFMHH